MHPSIPPSLFDFASLQTLNSYRLFKNERLPALSPKRRQMPRAVCSASGPVRVLLGRLACFSAVQMATMLNMARVRGHGYVRHSEEMPGNDRGNLKTVEVLLLYPL